jgi:hypothetical protein
MQVKEFQSDKIDQEDTVQGTDSDLDALQTSPGSVHVYSEPEISDTEPTSISPLPLSDILHDSSPNISPTANQDNQDKLPFTQRFDLSMYENPEVTASLYDGSNLTILEAVAHHMLWFTEHPGTSKDALSGILNMQHHSILPQPNLLPDCYSSALNLIEPFLVRPLDLDVCPNDCIIFRGKHAALTECPTCGAKHFKTSNVPFRRFRYLPIGPRLERLFGTSNLAQLW